MTDAAATAHVIHLHQAGEAVFGAWCEVCALPSGFTVAYLLESENPSPHYPVMFTVGRCAECGVAL